MVIRKKVHGKETLLDPSSTAQHSTEANTSPALPCPALCCPVLSCLTLQQAAPAPSLLVLLVLLVAVFLCTSSSSSSSTEKITSSPSHSAYDTMHCCLCNGDISQHLKTRRHCQSHRQPCLAAVATAILASLSGMNTNTNTDTFQHNITQRNTEQPSRNRTACCQSNSLTE